MTTVKLFIGDALQVLKSFRTGSADMIMTSPPYWGLRDYGVSGQIGLEPRFEEYIDKIAAVCSELMRVLKPTGSLYLNLGDTYAGSNMGLRDHRKRKSLQNPAANPQYPQSLARSLQPHVKQIRRKSLIGIPWRIALRLLDDGWILRNDVIWHKTNGLPSSVKDRLSNRYEHLFHFVKNEKYYYNLEAIREAYKPSSLRRFGGLVAQDFIKKESKYSLLNLPPRVQFSRGRTPVPNWLRESVEGEGKGQKAGSSEQLCHTMMGRIDNGMRQGGFFEGTYSHSPGKNPGDVIELAAVRRKSWMNTPGHPFTHKATGKPQNPGDFWSISASSFRGAHFSVYPERLCIKPVMSSCPPLVCRKCGAPKREVVGSLPSAAASFNIRVRDGQKGILAEKWGDRFTASALEIDSYREFFYQTWHRERVIAEGCSCDAGFEPGVVLDPFVGSGTTMKVALDLCRSAIGIELNPEYIAIVRQRVPQLREEDAVFFEKKQALQSRSAVLCQQQPGEARRKAG